MVTEWASAKADAYHWIHFGRNAWISWDAGTLEAGQMKQSVAVDSVDFQMRLSSPSFAAGSLSSLGSLVSPQFVRDHWRHHVEWCPSLQMSCMMRLLALQLPILLQLVQLWVVLGRLASPMDLDASDTSNASVANATVEESSPGTLANLKRKEFKEFNLEI